MSVATVDLLLQLASSAPLQAADHVARLEVVSGHASSSSDQTVLYRSGRHMREASQGPMGSGDTYTDLATGLEIDSQRDPQGALQRVNFHRRYFALTRLPPTARRDRAIGEACTISRFTRERSTTGGEICETDDGILLWYAFWYPPGDRTVLYQRATAIERRPVGPEEVLPPRDLMTLASQPPPATPLATPPTDYEVEMAGEDRADGSYVVRHHGRFFSRERRETGERWFHVSNGAVRVSYSETDTGVPRSLEIERIGSRPFDGLVPLWERIAGRNPEHVLGETCTWQDNMAIQSTDRNYQCRTADGISLKTEVGGHYGPVRHFTARRLSRRPLHDEDFAPPARALDWATWGITPAP